jgi:hypothetical protein
MAPQLATKVSFGHNAKCLAASAKIANRRKTVPARGRFDVMGVIRLSIAHAGSAGTQGVETGLGGLSIRARVTGRALRARARSRSRCPRGSESA